MEADYMVHDCCELITNLSVCLQEKSVEDLNGLINNGEFKELLKTKNGDLIPLVCKELNEENFKQNSKFFECCENLSLEIADKAYPEEALLEFLEQAECEDNVKFASVLKPIQKVLLRLPAKRGQSFEWVVNTIHRHVYWLQLPEDYHLEVDKQKLLDCDPCVQRIAEIYTVVVDFYVPFIGEACDKYNLKNILLQSFFLLLNKPMAVVDLEYDEKGVSSMRASAEKIIGYIVKLNNDIGRYINLIDTHTHDFTNLQTSEDDCLVDCNLKIEEFVADPKKFPALSFAVFYYLIFAEEVYHDFLSHVYSPIFILKTISRLTIVLLNLSESICQRKGLLLLNAVLKRVSEASLEFSFLDSEPHESIMEHLSSVSIYSEVKGNRKLAVEVLTSYLFKFEPKGLYLIFLNYKNVITHSGLCGYITTLLKDFLIKTFKANIKHDIDYFSGKRLHDLLIQCCTLPKGRETDLVDNADQIISSLNLLLFLTIWDKDNKTGIWDFIQELEQIFFFPLREGIVISTAHYELEIKNIEQGVSNSEGESLISVTVGNQQLGNMSKEEKIKVMNLSLNALSLMGLVLGRITESIEARKVIN